MLAAGVNLGVVRAVHRLHGEGVAFTGADFEKLILKLIPVTTGFIKRLLGNMRDFYFLILCFL